MIKLSIVLIAISFMACTIYTAQNDLIHNQYLQAQPIKDPNALYAGSWTSPMVGGYVCIKIYPDGTGKYCQSTVYSSPPGHTQKSHLKIYRDPNDHLYLINEYGARYKLLDYSTSHIDATAYGAKYKFLPGIQGSHCSDFFKE